MKRNKSVTRAIALTVSRAVSEIIDLFGIQPKIQALLTSFPDYDDQILAMAIELSKAKIPMVVLYHGTAEVPAHWISAKLDLKHVRMNSVQSFYHGKISKYVFYTHGFIFSESKSREQKIVNLWHGVPLKKIGFALGERMPNSDFTLATSRETSYLVEQSYSPTEIVPKILHYGFPRIDLLESKPSTAPITNFAWMPTFRSSDVGSIYRDGYVDQIGIGMNEANLRKFDDGLEHLKLNVEIILHPLAIGNIPTDLRAIRKSDFTRNEGSLYCYLNKFDGLISDYSSISVDFLVTQKPIYLLALDYVEYNNSRGLFGNLELLLGLPVFKTIEEFLDVLEQPRKEMTQLRLALKKWHDYSGMQRSRHIWDSVK